VCVSVCLCVCAFSAQVGLNELSLDDNPIRHIDAQALIGVSALPLVSLCVCVYVCVSVSCRLCVRSLFVRLSPSLSLLLPCSLSPLSLSLSLPLSLSLSHSLITSFHRFSGITLFASCAPGTSSSSSSNHVAISIDGSWTCSNRTDCIGDNEPASSSSVPLAAIVVPIVVVVAVAVFAGIAWRRRRAAAGYAAIQ
jgi:hypothetical protein